MLSGGDHSITRNLTRMNMLVSGTALLLACAAFVAYDLLSFWDTIVHSLSIQAQIAGSNSVSALVFNDPREAEKTLSALKAAPNVVSAHIYTLDGQPFAAYWRDGGGQGPPPPQLFSRSAGSSLVQGRADRAGPLDRARWEANRHRLHSVGLARDE